MQTPSDIEPKSIDAPLGAPAWRVALFYPAQGSWSESDYLELSDGPLVEFDNGHIEVLDMPTNAASPARVSPLAVIGSWAAPRHDSNAAGDGSPIALKHTVLPD